MKKLTYTTAIFMAMTASSVFAHHPAEGIVSADTYEMIDEYVADTPHAAMDLDTMGSAAGIDMGSSAMDQASTEQLGPESSQEGVIVDVDAPTDTASIVDTMVLSEDLAATLVQ